MRLFVLKRDRSLLTLHVHTSPLKIVFLTSFCVNSNQEVYWSRSQVPYATKGSIVFFENAVVFPHFAPAFCEKPRYGSTYSIFDFGFNASSDCRSTRWKNFKLTGASFGLSFKLLPSIFRIVPKAWENLICLFSFKL